MTRLRPFLVDALRASSAQLVACDGDGVRALPRAGKGSHAAEASIRRIRRQQFTPLPSAKTLAGYSRPELGRLRQQLTLRSSGQNGQRCSFLVPALPSRGSGATEV